MKMSALSALRFSFWLELYVLGTDYIINILFGHHCQLPPRLLRAKTLVLGEQPEPTEHGSPLALQQKEQPEETIEDGPGPPLTREQQRSLRASQARGRGGKGAGRGRGRGKHKQQDVVEDFDEAGAGRETAAEDLPKQEKPSRQARAKATPKCKAKAKAKAKAKVEKEKAKPKPKSKQTKNPPPEESELVTPPAKRTRRRSTGNGNGQDRSESKSGKRKEAGSPVPVDQRAGFKKFFGLFILFSCACIFNTGLVDGLGGWFDMVVFMWNTRCHFTTKQRITQHLTLAWAMYSVNIACNVPRKMVYRSSTIVALGCFFRCGPYCSYF